MNENTIYKIIKIIISIVLAVIITILLLPKTYDGLLTLYTQLEMSMGSGISIKETVNNTIFIFSAIEMIVFSVIIYLIVSKLIKQKNHDFQIFQMDMNDFEEIQDEQNEGE